MKRTFILIALIACISTHAAADIYQWTDSQGKTHYSDKVPKRDATDIRIRSDNDLPFVHGAKPVEPISTSLSTPQPGQVWADTSRGSLTECIKEKRKAVRAEQKRSRRAEALNEWLWKNCRDHATELRKIEQEMM